MTFKICFDGTPQLAQSEARERSEWLKRFVFFICRFLSANVPFELKSAPDVWLVRGSAPWIQPLDGFPDEIFGKIVSEFYDPQLFADDYIVRIFADVSASAPLKVVNRELGELASAFDDGLAWMYARPNLKPSDADSFEWYKGEPAFCRVPDWEPEAWWCALRRRWWQPEQPPTLWGYPDFRGSYPGTVAFECLMSETMLGVTGDFIIQAL